METVGARPGSVVYSVLKGRLLWERKRFMSLPAVYWGRQAARRHTMRKLASGTLARLVSIAIVAQLCLQTADCLGSGLPHAVGGAALAVANPRGIRILTRVPSGVAPTVSSPPFCCSIL